MTDTVSTFWYGERLPPLAWACLRSFVEHGHRVRLYSYRPLDLPEGVTREDAATVLPEDAVFFFKKSIAPFADLFRYQLLHDQGGWWVDTDVYCLTSRLPDQPHAWAEDEPGIVNNAILRFPPQDPLCALLLERARERVPRLTRFDELGPILLSEVLAGHGPTDHAGSQAAFYPLHWLEAHYVWLPECRDEVIRRARGASFLHLWMKALTDSGIDLFRDPPPGSYLADLVVRCPNRLASTRWRTWRTQRAIARHQRQGWVQRRRDGMSDAPAYRLAASGAFPPRSWVGALRSGLHSIDERARWLARGLQGQRHAHASGGAAMPPGRLRPFENGMRRDQHFILERSRELGPVFKLVADNAWTTCVLGHARARRLLAGREDQLPGVTIELNHLFPGGALRGMVDEQHKTYRRVLLQAVQATPLASHEATIRAFIVEALHTLTAGSRDRPVAGPEIRSALRQAASQAFLPLLFGIGPRSPRFARILAAYRRFGPAAPVYAIRDKHAAAFAELQIQVRELAEEIRRDPQGQAPSLLRHLVSAGTLDETALGNLIYLFEPAHFDVYSLWHWMIKRLGSTPVVVEAFRTATPGSEEARQLSEAIVFETLRRDQSEHLLRRATTDIVFESHLIPEASTVRVCIWEGHKDPEVFPDPFRFDPHRFLGRSYDIDQFAPFGLDKRRCIGGEYVMGLGAWFAEELVRGFEWDVTGDGPPIRGPFHWEPSPEFAIRLHAQGQSN
jgi:cytochrome P450